MNAARERLHCADSRRGERENETGEDADLQKEREVDVLASG
jgi:hypothetical protein